MSLFLFLTSSIIAGDAPKAIADKAAVESHTRSLVKRAVSPERAAVSHPSYRAPEFPPNQYGTPSVYDMIKM